MQSLRFTVRKVPSLSLIRTEHNPILVYYNTLGDLVKHFRHSTQAFEFVTGISVGDRFLKFESQNAKHAERIKYRLCIYTQIICIS